MVNIWVLRVFTQRDVVQSEILESEECRCELIMSLIARCAAQQIHKVRSITDW